MTTKTEFLQPRAYFELIVLPNYLDFIEDQTSVRKAYNAAISIGQMPDFISESNPDLTTRSVRETFKRENFCFLIADEMSVVIKHVFAGDRNNPRAVSSGMDVLPASSRFILSGGSKLDDGRSRLSPSFVTTNDVLMFEHVQKVDGKDLTMTCAVGWMLHGALQFVAKQIECSHLVVGIATPDEIDLKHAEHKVVIGCEAKDDAQ